LATPCARASLPKPGLHGSKGTHETARLQELAPPATAGREISVDRLLIDLVHLEKTVGGALVEDRILDVLADDARALLVAAAEEIGAAAVVMLVVMFVSVL